jgi:hypothetical protein
LEEEELAPSEMEMMYTQQMRTVSVRCRILRNELADIEDEQGEIRARWGRDGGDWRDGDNSPGKCTNVPHSYHHTVHSSSSDCLTTAYPVRVAPATPRGATASTVLTHLRGEENQLKGRLQGIMKELEVVREQVGLDMYACLVRLSSPDSVSRLLLTLPTATFHSLLFCSPQNTFNR